MFGINIVRTKKLQELVEENSVYRRSLEDIGWINVSLENDQTKLFGEGFKKMLNTCKIYYYRNPLAGHWVNLTTDFVFGEGVSKPKAKDEAIQEIVDSFWDDPDNKMTLTTAQGQKKLSNKLQYEGNLFFMLFTDVEGNVRVRVMDTTQIEDIVFDPEDTTRPIFYKVRDKSRRYDFGSDTYNINLGGSYSYYPDIHNANPEQYSVPENKLKKDVVMFHIKINCDINDKFGVPELYRGIDWIKAHKDMAGDLATLIKSLSTLAWKKKVKGTPTQVATLRSAMHAKLDLSNRGATAGSTQYENEAVDTTAISTPTGGAQIGEKGLKSMMLMVCAASGLFYHYFGDPETGNLATTTNMELPMIKKFIAYQTLWAEIIDTILQYIVNKKIELGTFDGSFEYNPKTNRNAYETEKDRLIDIDFPPIIEKDTKVVAEALEIAKRANLISDETAARIYLLSEQMNNIDDEIKKIDFTRMPPTPFGASPFPTPGKEEPQAAQPKEPEPKPKEEPIKEAIKTPEHTAALKLTKKSNVVVQRMNGYRNALAKVYNAFKESVRKSAKSSGEAGSVVGDVEGIDSHLQSLRKGMAKAAEAYFPVAVDIGTKYLQSHLRESQVRESLYEANGRRKGLLEEKLDWNEKYISTSLLPDIEKKIMESVRASYDTEEEFMAAIGKALDSFEGRMGQYAGAFWHVEEAAVKEAGKGTGTMVNFAGADDNSTCEGCNAAMAGNPYPINEAPEPGSHECDGRCRHALQIIT